MRTPSRDEDALSMLGNALVYLSMTLDRVEAFEHHMPREAADALCEDLLSAVRLVRCAQYAIREPSDPRARG